MQTEVCRLFVRWQRNKGKLPLCKRAKRTCPLMLIGYISEPQTKHICIYMYYLEDGYTIIWSSWFLLAAPLLLLSYVQVLYDYQRDVVVVNDAVYSRIQWFWTFFWKYMCHTVLDQNSKNVLEKAFSFIFSSFFLIRGFVSKNLRNSPSERWKIFYVKQVILGIKEFILISKILICLSDKMLPKRRN